MNSKPKFYKHFLADKIPLITAAVLMMAVSLLPGILLSEILDKFYNESNASALTMLWCIGQILLTVLILILFEKWFSPEYEGSMKGDGFIYGIKLIIPVIIFWAAWMTIKCLTKNAVAYPVDLEAIIKGARPGICEEIAFRGIATALILRKYRKAENIWIPVVFPAVFFGLTHLANISGPDDILQFSVVSAFAIVFGIIFDIIFIRSGCLWPTVILHSLYDIALMCVVNTKESSDLLILVDVGGLTIIMIIYLIVFLRNKEQSAALWDTKWHNKL